MVHSCAVGHPGYKLTKLSGHTRQSGQDLTEQEIPPGDQVDWVILLKDNSLNLIALRCVIPQFRDQQVL